MRHSYAARDPSYLYRLQPHVSHARRRGRGGEAVFLVSYQLEAGVGVPAGLLLTFTVLYLGSYIDVETSF